MRIVIAGAGEVGSHLAKLLSAEEQDILLIDDNTDRLAVLDANYNLMTFPGNPTSFSTLRDASVGNADLFIAVTPYEARRIRFVHPVSHKEIDVTAPVPAGDKLWAVLEEGAIQNNNRQ